LGIALFDLAFMIALSGVIPADPGLEPGESREPVATALSTSRRRRYWIAAFAGMTTANQ
jgi:hypothetical protein